MFKRWLDKDTIMVNRDYILRMAERFGRSLAIILGLRQFNQHEEALIYIDDLFLQSVGLTSSFINSIPEELLLQAISPLGVLNIDKCLWIAALLKSEGDIYADMGDTRSSYYRYLKALTLFLEALRHEQAIKETDFYATIEELISKLAEYELPLKTKNRLFAYYEQSGNYAQAEDTLFEMIEADNAEPDLVARGQAFYTRLLTKSEQDLTTGNFSRDEIAEGQATLNQRSQE